MKNYRKITVNLLIALVILLATTIKAAALSGEKRSRENYSEEPPAKRQKTEENNIKWGENNFYSQLFWDIAYNNKMNRTSVKNKEVYLFIGNTGAGKSTTVNYALGHQFIKASKEEIAKGIIVDNVKLKDPGGAPSARRLLLYKRKENVSIATMNTGNKSCTSVPKAYYKAEGGLVLVDNPGFKDTKGLEQRIFNVFTIRSLIEDSAGVKGIFFVIDMNSLETLRGQTFKECLEALNGMLLITDKNTKLIQILVTKTKEETRDDVEYHLKKFKKSFLEKAIEKAKSIFYNRKSEDNKKEHNFEKLIDGILKENRYHIIKPADDGQSWKSVEESVKKMHAIENLLLTKKDFLVRVQHTDAVGNLSKAFNEEAKPLIRIISKITNAPRSIKKAREKIKELKLIRDSEIKHVKDANEKFFLQRNKTLEKERDDLKKHLGHLSSRREVLWRNEQINFSNWFRSDEKELYYNDLPYNRRVNINIVQGWKEERTIIEDRTKGIYKGLFSGLPSGLFGRFSSLQVQFFVLQSAINQTEIAKVKNNIVTIEKEIKFLNQSKQELGNLSNKSITDNAKKRIEEEEASIKSVIENRKRSEELLKKPENKRSLEFFQENNNILHSLFNQKETKSLLKLIKEWKGNKKEVISTNEEEKYDEDDEDDDLISFVQDWNFKTF